MAYIGSTPPSRFVSNRAVTQFSGNGSTVQFTLEQAVAQDEDILVSVDGVIQEPTVAYEVSSGTTLEFDSAPSANSGNNIFVYYLASQVGTVGHPSTQGLAATSGTFSTTLSSTGNATVGGTLGVTGTSTLTGVTALGNTGSTVKSEGGAVTTNIAQGLCKAWSVIKGTDTFGTRDSFNQSDETDHTRGDYTTTHTNNFSDADGSPPNVYTDNTQNDGSSQYVGANRAGSHSSTNGGQPPQTSALRFAVYEGADADADGQTLDVSNAFFTRHGDLA